MPQDPLDMLGPKAPRCVCPPPPFHFFLPWIKWVERIDCCTRKIQNKKGWQKKRRESNKLTSVIAINVGTSYFMEQSELGGS